MSLAESIRCTIEIGKFVGAIWTVFCTLQVAIVGWVVTLRSNDICLDVRSLVAVSTAMVLIAAAIAYLVRFQQSKVRALYAFIRAHPELAALPEDAAEELRIFARSFRDLSILVFLPIVMTILISLIWFLR